METWLQPTYLTMQKVEKSCILIVDYSGLLSSESSTPAGWTSLRTHRDRLVGITVINVLLQQV